jgi:hypothetical protein
MKKVIMCIGPEGMGHHLSKDIFNEISKRGLFDGKFPEIIQYWNNSFTGNLDFHLNEVVQKALRDPEDIFMFQPSSPYDNPRDAVRRPDLFEFYHKTKKYLDIRFIFLYRNPIDATYSSIRRGFADGIYCKDNRIRNKSLYQAKIVEDNLIHTMGHLGAIPIGKWKTMVFEDLTGDPQKYVDPISEWLEIDNGILSRGMANVKKAHSTKDIPESELKTLERFFTEERRQIWEPFYLNNKF